MSLYLKIQNQISWIVKQIQCIKTGACIVCEHPVTSVNGKLGDVVLDGTEIELIDGGGVSVTQAISDLDSDLNNIVFPVTTVNAKTGDVVLDPDDLDDSETYHKFATADQLDHIQINTEVISNLDDVYLPLTGGTLTGQLTIEESLNLQGGFYQSNGFNNLTLISDSLYCNFLSSNKGFYFNSSIAIEKAVIGKASIIPITGVIDLSLANHYSFTMTQVTTFSFTNLPNMDMTFTLGITRGGTGTELYNIDTSGVIVKTASIEINETVGSLTEWWCKYYYATNTITINAVTGYTTL
jgi:hypothetical protein